MIIGCKCHAHSLPVRLSKSKILIFLCIPTQSPPSSQISSYRLKRSEVKVAQWCPTLWDPMNYTVHEILQARKLEWVVFPFSRGSAQPRDWTKVSCIAGRFFTYLAIMEAHIDWKHSNVHFLPWPLLPTQGFYLFFYVNGFLKLKILHPKFFTTCIYECTYMGLPW